MGKTNQHSVVSILGTYTFLNGKLFKETYLKNGHFFDIQKLLEHSECRAPAEKSAELHELGKHFVNTGIAEKPWNFEKD